MAKRVLANSIDNVKLANVVHDVVADRWDNWDLNDYLVYLVDTVASSALPYLAEQWDVDGLRGFSVASNEDEQRELIKQSIKLHKFMGTPWSIKEACRTVGFPVIVLKEGVPYPGDLDWAQVVVDDNYTANIDDNDEAIASFIASGASVDWACFSVYVSNDNNHPITADVMMQIKAFINLYKPVRCHLIDFGLYRAMEEEDRIFAPLNGVGREELDIQISGAIEWAHCPVDDNIDLVYDDTEQVITILIT